MKQRVDCRSGSTRSTTYTKPLLHISWEIVCCLNYIFKIEKNAPFEISVGTQHDENLRIPFITLYDCQKSLEVFNGVERHAGQVYRIWVGE